VFYQTTLSSGCYEKGLSPRYNRIHMSQFKKEYERLNEAQRLAVDTLDGPLMVIAGPGTGKTQLLGMRVANILKKTDTSVETILCLTFTDKAATNMRERLGGFIGAEAHGVVIKTFHGFGAEIINAYPDYFWNAAKLIAAPDALQIEIIESILSKLPHYNPLALKFAGNPTLTKDVQGSLKYAKEAGLTPEKLLAMTELNLAYIDQVEPALVGVLSERISKKSISAITSVIENLPEHRLKDKIAPLQPLSEIIKGSFFQATMLCEEHNKTTPLSEWKRQWFQTKAGNPGLHEERKRNIWWKELSYVYTDYRRQLHERGYFDYADMIIEVISQLEQNEDLRAAVQERFNYVLIDEFQDTNEAQMRLAHLVADHPVFEGKPNIMTVGDDDQAIYKFQGAELNNLLNFRRNYPQTKIIVLEENYRSHQNILDTAKQVIEQAKNRLVTHEKDISKNLRSAGSAPEGNLQHISYATQAEQYADIAKRIEDDFKPDTSIAVIARNNESLRQMANVLHGRGVPVHYEQQNNVFDHPLSRQFILICSVVQALLDGDSESVNAYLAQSLRHPMWDIPADTLWKLAVAGRKSDWFTNVKKDDSCSWIAEWFEDLCETATTENLNVLISDILGLSSERGTHESPILKYYSSGKQFDSEYLSGLSAIRLIRGFVSDFSRGGEPTLSEFLRFFEVHQQNNLILADETPFITAPHAVQLLTIYKAKGLEFDSVYIIDVVDSIWSPYKGGRKPPANLPLRPAGDDWDDYVRLMYVGITRAVSNVVVSSYRTNSTGKEILASPIISHVLPAAEIPPSKSEEAQNVLELNLAWPRLSSTNEKQLLADTLERYQLNATAIISFLDLEKAGPSMFLENQLLRIPRQKTPYQSHGTAMHAALEFGQKLFNRGDFALDKIVDAYRQNLTLEMMPKDQYSNWLEEGQRSIRFLFNDLGFAFNRGDTPERRFRDIVCNGQLIGGAFDSVQDDGTLLIITDYKTGKSISNLNSQTKSEGSKAWRHRTQLIFYALLAQHIPEYKSRTVQGRMVYVGADDPKYLTRTYEPTPEEIDRMFKLIGIIGNRIRNLDFPDVRELSTDLSGINEFENLLLSEDI
jgi:DNA helicase II / ATP-dependent DNA helicase PcrA